MRTAVNQAEDRLDGWKSIARYLGRDRSTVIRWANERDLPIRSLPGGKSRTVYAVKAELDAWMRSGGSDAVPPAAHPIPESPAPAPTAPAPSPPAPAPAPLVDDAAPPVGHDTPASRRRIGVTVAVLALFLIAAFLYASVRSHDRTQAQEASLPAALQTRLLNARDDIASRSAERLDGAIAALEQINRQAPHHAGVHAALAEGYLLAREFGSLPDALALEKARRESEAALQKDPEAATALRVLGVIAYWRDRQPERAGELFRHAIAAAPQDALAHQWYANILADNGENAAAFREFAAARELNPGAPYLLADYAWALWSAGYDQPAERLLKDLALRYPSLASVHDCLSVTAFARGDFRGYAHHLKLRASVRGAPELISYSRLIDQAVGQNGPALHDAMATRALAQAEASADSDHSWPAFVASTFGDRAQLRDILARARARHERWGAAGYTRRVATRWASDREIIAALQQLSQPRIEA